jgi:ElaB/YqjD/DUF883 family membrane-anchored ribosome-binding protein
MKTSHKSDELKKKEKGRVHKSGTYVHDSPWLLVTLILTTEHEHKSS